MSELRFAPITVSLQTQNDTAATRSDRQLATSRTQERAIVSKVRVAKSRQKVIGSVIARRDG
jgi:hypothetical protein